MLLIYVVAFDRVLSMVPSIPYVSPFAQTVFPKTTGGTTASLGYVQQSLPIVLVAALAVYLTPRLF